MKVCSLCNSEKIDYLVVHGRPIFFSDPENRKKKSGFEIFQLYPPPDPGKILRSKFLFWRYRWIPYPQKPILGDKIGL